MLKVTMKRGWQLAAAAALLAAAGAAQAQWMWVDAKGLKQVSDRPPPASIPAKNILKSPLKAAVADPVAAAEGKPAPGPVVELHGMAPPGEPATGAWTEREADYRKRKAEQAATEKKAADAAQQSGNKENACLLSQARKAQLDSGARIRTGDGRNEFMSDQERAEKVAATAAAIAKNCQ